MAVGGADCRSAVSALLSARLAAEPAETGETSTFIATATAIAIAIAIAIATASNPS